MKKLHWLLLVGILIGVFCLTFFYWPSKRPAQGPFPPGPNVRISNKPFPSIVSATPPSEVQATIRSFPITTPTIAASTPESRLMENVSNATPALRIRIADALGEPIPKGVISLNGKAQLFYGGLSICQDVPQATCELAASAEGYSSATATVDPSKTRDYSFTLEYVSSHAVTVYSEYDDSNRRALPTFKKPCGGADVFLWRGAVPPRPPANNTSVIVGILFSNDACQAAIVRTPGNVQFASIPRKLSNSPTTRMAAGEYLRPLSGDIITGVDLLNWGADQTLSDMQKIQIRFSPPPEINSRHLRIWDVFALAAKTDDSAWGRLFIRFVHENTDYYHDIRLPDIPAERTLFRQGKTDAEGQCTFSGLPPGIYYVQAQFAGRRSPVETFLPTRGHTKLGLFNSARVIVEVVKKELNALLLARPVLNAQVALTPSGNPDTQGKGIYTGTTNDLGRALFESVQWGSYRINVKLPEDYPLPPIAQEVVIDQSRHRFTVPVEGTGIVVSGRVINQETHAGVADYPIQLEKVNQYTHAIQKTDAEGNFTFTNVQPGWHELQPFLEYEEGLNYLPYPTRFLQAQSISLPDVPKIDLQIEDKNIEGLEYPVIPSVLTHLRGQVVDREEKPVPGVRLSLDDRSAGNNPDLCQHIKALGPQPSTTDAHGKFHLEIPAGADPEHRDYTFDLVANYVKVIPFSSSMNPFKQFQIIEDTIVPLAQGKLSVTFRIGDDRSNLKIVLDASLFTKRIIGLLKTEDGGPLDGIGVSAIQDDFTIHSDLSSDGSFTIDGVKPGEVVLRTESRLKEVELGDFKSEFVPEYHNEWMELEVPSGNNPDLYVEITLLKAGYLAGVVLDNQGVPQKGAWIFTKIPGGAGLGSFIPTESDGLFIIQNVPLNYTYDLTAYDKKSNAVLGELKGVQPTADHLVIQCP